MRNGFPVSRAFPPNLLSQPPGQRVTPSRKQKPDLPLRHTRPKAKPRAIYPSHPPPVTPTPRHNSPADLPSTCLNNNTPSQPNHCSPRPAVTSAPPSGRPSRAIKRPISSAVHPFLSGLFSLSFEGPFSFSLFSLFVLLFPLFLPLSCFYMSHSFVLPLICLF